MCKVLSFGSLNIDMIFSLDHIVNPGETISSSGFKRSAGGKGANQAASLSKAGCDVYLAGKVGKDGLFLLELLSSFGVDTSLTKVTDNHTGMAIIEVDKSGQNSIILYPGENKSIQEDEIRAVFDHFNKGDYLILQNEINNLDLIFKLAKEKEMKICFNPSPFDDDIFSLPLEYCSYIVVNELEAASLCKSSGSYEEILDKLSREYKDVEVIMTLGKDGAYCISNGKVYYQAIIDLPVKDTTAAGDTFIGYFLSQRIKGEGVEKALLVATAASALAVSSPGAMESIPYKEDVFKLLEG